MIFSFTKKKFNKLSREQKHKKCAFVLQKIYHSLLERKTTDLLYEEYQSYLQWMEEKTFIQKDLKNISDQYHFHLALAKVNLKEHNLLPRLRTGDGVAKRKFANNAIYLDNIRSAYNVGSILRSAESFRIGSVHFAKKTPYIDHPKVQKISMDTAKHIPTYRDTPLTDLPRPIIVIDTAKDALSLYDFVFPDTFTLVMGNEEYGTSDQSLKEANYILEIPLYGKKNSINVASAFSIIASEWQRQMLKKEKTHV